MTERLQYPVYALVTFIKDTRLPAYVLIDDEIQVGDRHYLKCYVPKQDGWSDGTRLLPIDGLAVFDLMRPEDWRKEVKIEQGERSFVARESSAIPSQTINCHPDLAYQRTREMAARIDGGVDGWWAVIAWENGEYLPNASWVLGPYYTWQDGREAVRFCEGNSHLVQGNRVKWFSIVGRDA